MKWIKQGLLYQPSSIHTKLKSHAANPLAIHLENDLFRIFFSGRDVENRSSVGFVDVDILKRKVTYEHDKPVFEHGDDLSFYSHGVSIGNCYESAEKKYMLFMGWKYPKESHWYGQIGRLEVNDDFSLSLDSHQPFLPLDNIDNLSLSYPWVTKHNDQYLMWYGTTSSWDAGNGEMIHTLSFATSKDGDQWQKHGLAIPFEVGLAQAFSRPTVLVNESGFHMWFSYRSGEGEKYRIGYAHKELTQTENELWELDLEGTGIDVSETGWDSEMIEYPFVFEHKQDTYMLYNGNSFGKTGFGLAKLEK
jgi:predicted GH43/DUF377 family glycosyl hydrolase